MNVKEMIEELSKYPDDMQVTVLLSYVGGIRKKTVYMDHRGDFCLVHPGPIHNLKEVEVLAII